MNIDNNLMGKNCPDGQVLPIYSIGKTITYYT